MVVQFFLLQENVQYERVAGIADTVQRGLGTLAPTSKFAKIAPKGKIEKMSEPVQVYTACQFVSPQIFPAFSKAVHKNFGKNILMRYKRMNII